MAEITFITGGCRSGKSTYARRLGESLPGPRAFLATCPPDLDGEMSQRVVKHRLERREGEWETVEEAIRLDAVLAKPGSYRVFLLDCLSLWVNNLLYEASLKKADVSEGDMERRCGELLEACAKHDYSLIVVSNEVGMGIVPANALSRHYRDLLGRANQIMAQAAGKAVFMVSGIPMRLKG
jgi:adenosylcobinamide kinase/adenosylcobinamide-phosphate guanylyltransferase